MQLRPTRFAVLLAGFVASYGANAQETVALADSGLGVATSDVGAALAVSADAAATTNVGRISVEGTEGPGSTGLIAPESTPKARSSVDKSYIDKTNPSSNPFQDLALLPGVNTYSQDASGLFGGNIRVRGFNSDQLGFTINGAPVNDSGNFAVFPQEYTDSENLCNIFVTQGSVDSDAPHVGASGGNIGLTTCSPKDNFGVTTSYSGGSLEYQRTFARIDSGLIGGRWKSYISYSKALIDKFKGDGRADRNHVDFGTEFDLGKGSKLSASVLYNRALNNNIRSLTRAQVDSPGGQFLDYDATAPNHTAPNSTPGSGFNNCSNTRIAGAGTAQCETAPGGSYSAFQLNPFQNYLATFNAGFQLTPTLRFDFSPYFWHGFGTGGGQLQTLAENTGNGIVGRGVGDLNGDGDATDTVLVYRSNVTTTNRPGATFKFTYTIASNTISLGYWAERAHHTQTAPSELITSSDPNRPLLADTVVDRYFDSPYAWIRNQNGSITQTRDQLTISTGKSLFITDTISLLNDKLTITPAFRHSGEDRDFNNRANIGTGAGGNGFGAYEVHTAAIKNLPSLGINYQITDTQSVFANGARSFRVPSNFIYQNLASGGTFVNGVYTNYNVRNVTVVPETANNFDLGYRYAGRKVTFSSSLFYNFLQNRLAQSVDPDSLLVTDTNVGTSKIYGAEVEAGWNFLPHFTAYSSASYTRSIISDDIQAATNRTADTSNKQFPDTPNWLAATSLQYERNNYYVFVEGKYTGRRQTTLVNDESIAGYAVLNVGAGYTFPKFGPVQAVKLKLVANNVTNQDFLNLNGGSGSNFTINAQGTGGRAPTYYVGAPVSFALTLSTEF
jgi:iron complex outermembrane recepter protein